MKRASILFVNRVYPPEGGATGVGIERVARGFLRAGWSVTVVTTAVSGQSGSFLENGVKVIRIPDPVHGRSLLLRAFSTALMIPGLFFRTLREPSPDVIVTMTDPPLLFLIGPILRFIKGSRIIHWAHDLYPDVAVRAGILSPDGIPSRLLGWLSRRALSSHDRVIAVGRCMKALLASDGIPSPKIIVIPNTWAGAGILPVARERSFLGELGLEDRFTVMYSGNFGRVHDFETVLSAAKILQDRGNRRIVFLFSGDGPGSAFLVSQVERLGLLNVRFLARCDEGDLSRSLASGDVHLVTMRGEMSGVVVPSKYYGVVAAARPCVFIGPEDSEIALSLRESGNGLSVRPGNADDLVDALLRIAGEPCWSERAAVAAQRLTITELSGEGFVRMANEVISRSDTAVP